MMNADSQPCWSDLAATLQTLAPAFLERADVVGIALGKRRRGGRLEEEQCLRVYVKEKLPPSRMREADVLPDRVRGPGESWLAVDVEEIGAVTAASDPGGGATVRRGETPLGTVGVTFRNQVNAQRYALTCHHVAIQNGEPAAGLSILLRSGLRVPVTDVLALPLDRSARIPAPGENLDAAVLRLGTSGDGGDLEIATFSDPIRRVEDPSPDDGRVFMYSPARDATLAGQNIDIKGRFRVGEVNALLTEVFCVDIDARRGDSGSILVRQAEDHLVAIGMLVAVGGGKGFFQPLRAILRRFGPETGTVAVRLGLSGEDD